MHIEKKNILSFNRISNNNYLFAVDTTINNIYQSLILIIKTTKIKKADDIIHFNVIMLCYNYYKMIAMC